VLIGPHLLKVDKMGYPDEKEKRMKN
jgi:hypothetical protein